MVKSKKENPPVCSWTESRILPTATLGSSPSLIWFRIANRRSKLTNNLLPTLKRPAVKTRQLLSVGFQIFPTKKFIPYWYTTHSQVQFRGSWKHKQCSCTSEMQSSLLKHQLLSQTCLLILKATRKAVNPSHQPMSSHSTLQRCLWPWSQGLPCRTQHLQRPTPVNQGKAFLTRTFRYFHSQI